MENKYYVYEWYNKDTGEVFYVGKGCRNRYKNTSHRNKFFKDYYKTHNCDVRILFSELTDEQSYNKEIELIKYYKENTNYRLTNQTDGGEGNSLYGEQNPKFGKGYEIIGVKNPFYGKKHSEKTRNLLSELASEGLGEKNPFYGKKHSVETKKKISQKQKGRYNGEKNPNYGKNHSKETKKLLSELMKKRKYDCICKMCGSDFKGNAWNSSKCDNCK